MSGEEKNHLEQIKDFFDKTFPEHKDGNVLIAVQKSLKWYQENIHLPAMKEKEKDEEIERLERRVDKDAELALVATEERLAEVTENWANKYAELKEENAKQSEEIERLKKMCLEEIVRNTEKGKAKEVSEIGHLNAGLHKQLTNACEQNTNLMELLKRAKPVIEDATMPISNPVYDDDSEVNEEWQQERKNVLYHIESAIKKNT